MLSKHVGVKESNEAEVLTILEALQVFWASFQDRLIVESDSLNPISWISCKETRPWKS